VLVDVDRNSLCMDPFAARATITEQTRAILLVHLYCSVADLDTFLGIAAEFDLSLIEDAAQAHGAVWRGRKVGSIGRIGVFSMQQGKLLTAGEGGACITDDDELADRIYRLRTDGRRLRPNAQAGRAGLEEVGARGSANFCLSELQAACLSAQLLELEELNAVRWESARLLRTALREIPGVTLPVSSCGTERESYYHFIAFVAPEFFAGRPVEALCEALTADLGIEVHPVYDPLPEHPLAYDLQAPRSGLEGVRWVRRHALALHHPILLTGELGRTRIAEALKRLQRSAHLLPGTSASPSC
jgi:dTDP-4-amino-4,6-dideoxygalactose transaminase